MKSCLEALMLGEVHSNEHNSIHKSFQELIQTQQEHLKTRQEKQQTEFSVSNKQREVYR